MKTWELATVDYGNFLDRFIPSGPQKSTSKYQSMSKNALTAELKISYCAQMYRIDASVRHYKPAMEGYGEENCTKGRAEDGELDRSVCNEHFSKSKLSDLTVSSRRGHGQIRQF